MIEHEDKWWVELSGDDSEEGELAMFCSQPDFSLCDITKKQTFETEIETGTSSK